jgi:tRNAThr (cytosine32-N3)-methyltransferase
MTPTATARRLIDLAHAADPTLAPNGKPAELLYADRIESWVARLVPGAPEILLLAARCQHLERWHVPRASFPAGKPGYLTWRRSLYTKQAGRAKELLLEAGVAEDDAQTVFEWVAKIDLKINPGTQALEDAAILVFLEFEIGDFVVQHADYTKEKWLDILRKNWRKLSGKGQQAALTLDYPPAIAALLKEALEG